MYDTEAAVRGQGWKYVNTELSQVNHVVAGQVNQTLPNRKWNPKNLDKNSTVFLFALKLPQINWNINSNH